MSGLDWWSYRVNYIGLKPVCSDKDGPLYSTVAYIVLVLPVEMTGRIIVAAATSPCQSTTAAEQFDARGSQWRQRSLCRSIECPTVIC